MTMRTELKKHLQDYWFRDMMAIFGIIVMTLGAMAPDDFLFLCGGVMGLCGINLIQSQRISDLKKKIEDLEKRLDESF